MKKYFVFAAMALATFMNYSCSEVDKPGSPTVGTYEFDGKEYPANIIATFKAELGAEVSLTLGTYLPNDVYGVDFGDGKIVSDSVGWQNGGVREGDGEMPSEKPGTAYKGATIFKGKVAGEGIVTVYGNSDLWYLVATGGLAPTSFDQQGLKKVVQMSFSGANVDKVELPSYETLTHFSFNNSSVKSVDVSKAVNLTSLIINNTTESTYEPQLESIDLSKNTKLDYLSLQGNQNNYGKLTSIDLSKNIKLKDILLQYNKLTQITLPADYTSLNNKGVPAKITLSLNNNELTAINDLDKIPEKSLVYIQSNKFTLATLPKKTSNIKTYSYVPQSAYEVPETVSELDLSSQLTATGVLAEPVETTYSFVTASGTTLVAGTDYEVTAPGKFKFLTAQTEKVHGVMATLAFPNFKGNNAYKTTEFTVSVAAE